MNTTGFVDQLRQSVIGHNGVGLTDGQLLGSFVERRDEDGFAALVHRHGPMVWGVCRRLLPPHDAEDAFQATFLVLVRKAASVVPRELVGNWLYGVAYQVALQAQRSGARRRGREQQVPNIPEPAVSDREPQDDLHRLLDEELSRLPGKYRAVIVLCELEGKTRKDVAGRLGVPEGTVAGWLARARAMLGHRLARRGVVVPAGAVTAGLGEMAAASVPPAVTRSTIQAAGFYATDRTATAGVVSAKAVDLTNGVLKTMLLSKLKSVTVLLLVAALVSGSGAMYRNLAATPPAPKPAAEEQKPPKDDLDGLQGSWRAVRWETDGLTLGEGRPEIKDIRLVIDKSSATMTDLIFPSPQVKKRPEVVKAVGTLALDPAKKTKQIVFTWDTYPELAKEDLVQRGIYELNGDTLKFCFYLPGQDKRPLVPTEFSAGYGTKRYVATWKRVPPPEKSGEKRPDPAGSQKNPAGEKVGPTDTDRLQGVWQPTEVALRGGELEKVPEDEAGRMRAVFKGDGQMEWRGFKMNYTLDPSKTLKQMDWLAPEGEKALAIYELDGDTLKVCMANPGEDRPTEFKSVAGPGPEGKVKLMVFKRVKAKNDK